MKANEHDRIIVSNDPVNFVDPWGLDIDNTKGKTSVFYKGEHDNNVHEVKPGKSFKGYHDGVIEPSTGDVYKTRGEDSLKYLYYQDDVSVDENGTIHGINSLVGSGKVDQAFREGHDDWEKLFKKADEIKARCQD